MLKTKINVDINSFPKKIHQFLENAEIYDSSSNPSITVLYSDLGYYVKIAEKGSLSRESDMNKLLYHNKIGVELISYVSEDKDYMVTCAAKGQDATHYLADPERLCEALAKAMRFLHTRPIDDIPVSSYMENINNDLKHNVIKQDTFIHGDFCLPNIIFDNWQFSSFIDVGMAGIGDRHIDIYWALWSLNFNLKTNKYSEYFLNLYGKENYDRRALRIIAEIES